ncbi:MAG: glycoside hydrolase family 9 protein [Ruminococcus sp.]|nr:glycoside hydrolase family 9 protein [Ruminococcus sp.]
MFFNSKKVKSVLLSSVLAVSAVAAPVSATVAPSLTAVAADSDNYARLLQYSLYFYDANMCGDISGCGLSWRGNCHTSDAVPGGFHDAGDHAMFGQPQGYAASTLGWAYFEFPDAFDETGQTEHLKMITNHFCEFFRNATELNGNTVSRVLIEKGEGNVDHEYWGPPEAQGDRGRMLWSTGGAANVTAEYAAALAVNYLNFKNPEDLKYAEALYDFSTKDRGFHTASGGGETFYDAHWTGSDDEIAWAAGWLYKATGNSKYLSELQNAPTAYSAHSWESVQLGAQMLKGEFANDWSGLGYMSKFSGDGYCIAEPEAWQWGSARYNCSAQFTTLVAAKHNHGSSTWAKGQMDYILGAKGVGSAPARCFVVGFDSTSPVNVHHRAASGYNGYGEMGDSTVAKAGSPVLVGALAGGPADTNGTYSDSIKDYKCNEVALDYNAGLVGAAAGLYHFYKTGKIDTQITGVTKIYTGSSNPNPGSSTSTTTTTVTTSTTSSSNGGGTTSTTTPPSGGDVVLLPADMVKVGTEEGSDGGINNFVEFKPNGAKSATLYVKINSSDTEISGEFGTWTGEWLEDKFEAVKAGSDKVATVDYTIPSNVGSTVKAIVWWPHGDAATIEKIVLHGTSSGGTTTTTKTTTTTTTTTTTSTTTTSTTTKPNQDITVSLWGDANCDNQVNLADAVYIMQVISNPDKYGEGSVPYGITAQGKANADVDKSKDITNKDALYIQKYKLNLIPSLPV